MDISRWEPTIPTPDAETASENASAVSGSSSTISHAARLMSLANYIRHILSLTVAVPNAQPQAHARQQQVKDEPRNQDSNTPSSNSSSGSTASSSGPGPIKSESNRRHRFSPAYHHHPARRSTHHSERGSSSTQYHSEYPGYREGNYTSESRETSQNYPRASYDASHTQQPTSILPPLLKIPFPNLTLTLALIYVDRLKAKYPKVKGEPGCSHRLFLVAFIIAAKYRCSVELSPPVSQDLDGVDQEQEIGSYRNNPDGEGIEDDGRSNQSLDARLNAELIFSNHAWVRLLNLGSFYRQPSADAAASSSSATENREQSSSAQPSHSAQAIESLPPLSSIINNAASSPVTGMLQVEDLDRMEAEFLTFLQLDLATMSHDLETCWNLLVGKSEAQL
ncbi:hypothetical protein BGZ79_002097 [Entomortierella chlamydospora]|nr:hypothetical protein BGZ79_002097 [Entomortierella chlamydospora]